MGRYYIDEAVSLYHGDCMDVLRGLPDCSVDAVVTDPPYGLGFMGKQWDALPPGVEWAEQCLRVLKPGGHMLAFGGSRTWHRLAMAIEDAGFELRDSIAWLYGSGFPKSLNLVTEAGERTGWGTALKPAFEPIVIARKPLAGTVAANVQQYGTGALNIDDCRVQMSGADRERIEAMGGFGVAGYVRPRTAETFMHGTPVATEAKAHAAGRWPTNVVLDESQAAELDRSTGILRGGANPVRRGSDKFRDAYGDFRGKETCIPARGADSGGASRFFPTFRYEAKAPASQRPKGEDGTAHPTVKPLELMRWLVRLVTPPGGVVLEPFAGSGTTVEACLLEGFRCIAVEREAAYLPLILQRISKPLQPGIDFGASDSAESRVGGVA